jgi:hypothetical protein
VENMELAHYVDRLQDEKDDRLVVWS